MPNYTLVVEVDRLKNLVESLGWKVVSEMYINDTVTISVVKAIHYPLGRSGPAELEG